MVNFQVHNEPLKITYIDQGQPKSGAPGLSSLTEHNNFEFCLFYLAESDNI